MSGICFNVQKNQNYQQLFWIRVPINLRADVFSNELLLADDNAKDSSKPKKNP